MNELFNPRGFRRLAYVLPSSGATRYSIIYSAANEKEETDHRTKTIGKMVDSNNVECGAMDQTASESY